MNFWLAFYGALIIVAILVLVPAPLITRSIINLRPNWSGKLVSLGSASIVPAIMLILAALLIGLSGVTTIDLCWSQGCVMDFEIAQILEEASGLAFFVGLTLSGLVVLLMRRSRQAGGDDTIQ
jgi:hypothetical protein